MSLVNGPYCACNSYTYDPSGGMGFGGAAETTDNIIHGGIALGGSALVQTSQPFDGLVSIWHLTETDPPYIDHAGGNDGFQEVPSYRPTPDTGIFCLPSQRFDGQNDHIQMENDSLSPDQGFSVSMWVRIETQFIERTWFARGAGNGLAFRMGYSFLNQVYAAIHCPTDDGDFLVDAFSISRLNPDQWYHVAVSWSPNDHVRIFVDGVADGVSWDLGLDQTIQPTGGTWIGRFNQGGYPTGNIQDVRLYPTALGAEYFQAEHDNYCSPGFYMIGENESYF